MIVSSVWPELEPRLRSVASLREAGAGLALLGQPGLTRTSLGRMMVSTASAGIAESRAGMIERTGRTGSCQWARCGVGLLRLGHTGHLGRCLLEEGTAAVKVARIGGFSLTRKLGCA